MNIKGLKKLLIIFTFIVTTTHVQATPINIPNKPIGQAIELALQKLSYQQRIDGLRNIIEVSNRQKLAYDLLTQKAVALALQELFNQRVTQGTPQTISSLSVLLEKAVACPIFTQMGVNFWNPFINTLRSYIIKRPRTKLPLRSFAFFTQDKEGLRTITAIEKNSQHVSSKSAPPSQTSTYSKPPKKIKGKEKGKRTISDFIITTNDKTTTDSPAQKTKTKKQKSKKKKQKQKNQKTKSKKKKKKKKTRGIIIR